MDVSVDVNSEANDSLKMANPAWADAMSKILKTKKRKGKPLVLSKAKIITEADLNKIKQEKEDVDESFEVVDKGGQKVAAPVKIEEIKDEKPDLEHLEPKIPNRIRVGTPYSVCSGTNGCFEYYIKINLRLGIGKTNIFFPNRRSNYNTRQMPLACTS